MPTMCHHPGAGIPGRTRDPDLLWCGLDFSKPVNAFFYDPLNPEQPLVDGTVSLTGFAHGRRPATSRITPKPSNLTQAEPALWWPFPLVFRPPRNGKTVTWACTPFE